MPCTGPPVHPRETAKVPYSCGMPASHALLILLAGVVGGIFNGVAGGASLITFPVLLALGYPALTANITNTVGIWPSYLGRPPPTARDRRPGPSPGPPHPGRPGRWRRRCVAPAHDVIGHLRRRGALAGPGAAALFGLQPLLRRPWTGTRSIPARGPCSWSGVFAASVYGGYFGAAMGVMFLAVLGLALPVTLAHTNGMRAILSMVVNGVAAIVFLIHGGLAWDAVGLARPRQPGRRLRRGPAGPGAARPRPARRGGGDRRRDGGEAPRLSGRVQPAANG